MEFSDIVLRRYATKKFDGKKIPEERVRELMEIVRLSPSAVNIQPWKIKIVADQKTKETLAPHTYGGREQAKTCSHLLVFCADTRTDQLIEKLEAAMKEGGVPEDFRTGQINVAKALTARMSPEEKIAWVKCQVFLALGNAVNGAKALGFDSCAMTGFNPGEYGKLLETPEYLIPTVLCAIGYGADIPVPKVRFHLDDILF